MGLRLAIDARYPRESFPGIGRHLDNLLRSLPGAAGPHDELLALVPRSPAAGVTGVPSALRPRSLAEQWRLPGQVAAARPDALLAPYAFTALRCPCPRALLVYDDTALDPRHGLRPVWRRLVAEAWLRASARRSALLLTLSESARRALATRFPARAGDLVVTGSAPDPAFGPRSARQCDEAQRALGLTPPYFVHLGTDRPHKNVGALVRALPATGLPAQGVGLALAGPGQRPRPGDPPWLKRLGLVPDELLPALLSGALAVVLPSLDEGLGLPALEALACGAPVAAARRGALPEVLGDCGLLFDPLDERQLAQALLDLARQPGLRADLAGRGPARAARFEWRGVAERTLAACRRAAAAPSRWPGASGRWAA